MPSTRRSAARCGSPSWASSRLPQARSSPRLISSVWSEPDGVHSRPFRNVAGLLRTTGVLVRHVNFAVHIATT